MYHCTASVFILMKESIKQDTDLFSYTKYQQCLDMDMG